MGFSEHFTRWFNHFGGLPRKHMDRKDHDIFSEVLLINSTYPLSFQTLLITAVTWAQRCPRVPPRVSHGTAPSCPQLPNRGPSWRRHVSAGSSERSKPRCTSKLDHPQAALWNWWNVSFWVKASKKKSNMKYINLLNYENSPYFGLNTYMKHSKMNLNPTLNLLNDWSGHWTFWKRLPKLHGNHPRTMILYDPMGTCSRSGRRSTSPPPAAGDFLIFCQRKKGAQERYALVPCFLIHCDLNITIDNTMLV